MTYTDEQVKALVEVAELVLADRSAHNKVLCYVGSPYKPVHWGSLDSMEAALKPFRPDPEEELIEAMCVAFTNTPQRPGFVMVPWDERDEEARTNFFHCMANALAVVKEKGLPT